MNEELKIIIKAVTTEARKNMQAIKKELQGISSEAKNTSGKFSTAMKGMAKAGTVAVAGVVAITAAIVAFGKKTLESQKQIAQLNSAFQTMGKSTSDAANVYAGFYRFLGESDTATEASNLLIKLTQNEKDLAQWTKILQGVYASFPDSLPIEGLVESANETARVGVVTGNLADALNWAGSSEEAFNAKLAQTTSYEEREALIRNELNLLYGKASENYEKNNKAILNYNESQAKLAARMAQVGAVVTPLLTALSNLGTVLLDVLKPALDFIIPQLVTMVEWITKGIQSVMGLFSAITGGSSSIKTSVESTVTGIGNAASGAGNLTSGLNNAAKAAEKVKRATMGFDELNILSLGSSSSDSSSGGSSGSNAPAYMAPQLGSQNFTTEVEETEGKVNGLVTIMKKAAEELKNVFAPTIEAWTSAFGTIKQSWNNAKDNFYNGAISIKESLQSVVSYVLGDFVPSIVNSFSTELAPVITDILGFALEEVGKLFEDLGGILKDTTDNLIIPTLDAIKNTFIDIFESIGNSWDEHGEPFLEDFEIALTNIRDYISSVYYDFIEPIVSKAITTFKEAWNDSLKPMFKDVIDAILEIGECLLELYNEYIDPIVDWIVENVIPIIRKFFQNLVDAVGEKVKLIGHLISAFVNILKGLIQFITGVLTGDWEKAWEGIKNVFAGIWDGIVDIFGGAWENIKESWSNAGQWFSNVWSGIKNAFGNVGDWFKNTFSNAWQKVKDVFSKGGQVFVGIKDGILNGLKTVVNGLIGGINKVIKVPFDGLNGALRKIKGINILGLKPFDWIKTISVPQIPKLAKGGIVDRTTIAMVGERGKEAILPLENNTAWMDKLAEKLSPRNDTPTKIVLTIDGKELGWANIKSINDITRQTGSLQLTLA